MTNDTYTYAYIYIHTYNIYIYIYIYMYITYIKMTTDNFQQRFGLQIWENFNFNAVILLENGRTCIY